MIYWTSELDGELDNVEHYRRYPEMRPWVGLNYGSQARKVLIIAESHYLEEGNTIHHDAVAWYSGVSLDSEQKKWIKTRGIIQKGLEHRWKERGKRGKAIYRVIESALTSARIAAETTSSPFLNIAFMNYFQRPAQNSGDSIRVAALDMKHSFSVCTSVIAALRPDLVIFCSSLAWDAAKDAGIRRIDFGYPIAFRSTSHPTCHWWNNASKKRKGMTGREAFIDALSLT